MKFSQKSGVFDKTTRGDTFGKGRVGVLRGKKRQKYSI